MSTANLDKQEENPNIINQGVVLDSDTKTSEYYIQWKQSTSLDDPIKSGNFYYSWHPLKELHDEYGNPLPKDVQLQLRTKVTLLSSGQKDIICHDNGPFPNVNY